MKVRFLVSMAGPTEGYRPGEVVDLPEDLALKRIAGGSCVAAEPEPAETAAVQPAERSVGRRMRSGRKR